MNESGVGVAPAGGLSSDKASGAGGLPGIVMGEVAISLRSGVLFKGSFGGVLDSERYRKKANVAAAARAPEMAEGEALRITACERTDSESATPISVWTVNLRCRGKSGMLGVVIVYKLVDCVNDLNFVPFHREA